MADRKQNEVVVTGPDTVFAYPSLAQPTKSNFGGEERYRITLIIPKSDTVTEKKLRDAIRRCYDANAEEIGVSFNTIKYPLKDGDLKAGKYAAFKNAWYVEAISKVKPQLVDRYGGEITDPEEIRSGNIGRASLSIYAYNKGINKGVGCGIRALKKLREGKPLGNYVSAELDFEGYDDGEDEDFLS